MAPASLLPASLLVLWFFVAVISAVLGAGIAESKNRSAWAGALVGLFLGVLGLAILALMSEAPTSDSATARDTKPLPPPTRSAATNVRPGGAGARLNEVAAAVDRGAYGKAFAPMDFEADQAERRGDLEALEILLDLARRIDAAPDADPKDRVRAQEFVDRLNRAASSFVEYTRPPEPPVTEPMAEPDAETALSPIDIVKERYARGEISREEFQQFAADLA